MQKAANPKSTKALPQRAAFLLAACLSVAGTTLSFGQGTLHIAFEGLPGQDPGTAAIIQSYSESGIMFTPNAAGDGFVRMATGCSPLFPDNGTTFLQALSGNTLMFSRTDGSLLGLTSVDLAGYSTVLPDFFVDFVGYRADGATVTTRFSGSGLQFRTFFFGSGFTALTRVEVPGPIWSMDNLVVSVPEPCVWQLTGLGLLLAANRAVKRN
jgi:hypothetical protein